MTRKGLIRTLAALSLVAAEPAAAEKKDIPYKKINGLVECVSSYANGVIHMGNVHVLEKKFKNNVYRVMIQGDLRQKFSAEGEMEIFRFDPESTWDDIIHEEDTEYFLHSAGSMKFPKEKSLEAFIDEAKTKLCPGD